MRPPFLVTMPFTPGRVPQGAPDSWFIEYLPLMVECLRAADRLHHSRGDRCGCRSNITASTTAA
jgi:hypothetical protein